MNDTIFREFPPASIAEWEEIIRRDLKGKSPESAGYITLDGIVVTPHYTRENVPHNTGVPGISPYLRGLKTRPENWDVIEIVEGSDRKKLNKEVLKALNNGANALYINTEPDDTLFKDIDPRYISTYFNGKNPQQLVAFFEAKVRETGGDPAEIQGCYGIDPLGHSLITGKKADTVDLYTLIVKHHKTLPRFGFIDVSAAHFHNAGASQAQEIAFSLAQAHQYLTEALESGIPVDEISARIQFKSAAGNEYFVEIAKFRALRTLWAFIIDNYNPRHGCSSATRIKAETSSRFAAVYDEYNNILRGTVQCMAAALGGADAIAVLPYNRAYADTEPFSRRMARNTNLILQEEAHFNKTLDPAGGSYFIDHLTRELMKKSWKLFQEVESKGGFGKCVESNFIQNAIEMTALRQKKRFENGDIVLVGVNKYTDENESVRDKIKAEKKPQPVENPDFKPLILSRLAEDFEKERMKKEGA